MIYKNAAGKVLQNILRDATGSLQQLEEFLDRQGSRVPSRSRLADKP